MTIPRFAAGHAAAGIADALAHAGCVVVTHSLGWLRQEENQYLDVPPEVARTLTPALRDIIGHRMHQALGYSLNREVGVRPD